MRSPDNLRYRLFLTIVLIGTLFVSLELSASATPGIPTYPDPISSEISFLHQPDENGRFEIKVEIEAHYNVDFVVINMVYNDDIIRIDKKPRATKGSLKSGKKIVRRLKGSVRFVKDGPPAFITLLIDYIPPYQEILKASKVRHGEGSRVFKYVKESLDADKDKTLRMQKQSLGLRPANRVVLTPKRFRRSGWSAHNASALAPLTLSRWRSDGTAEYMGTAYVKKTGRQSGRVAFLHYKMLAIMLNEMGFFELNDDYSKHATDLPSAITTVRRGSTTKTVRNYGNAGPVTLWAIEMAIDAVVAKIEWQQEAGKQL